MIANPLRPIYLDYHSTTPVDARVAALILRHLTEVYGNASSVDHIMGDQAEHAVENAREQVAELVGVSPDEVIFTSGATESMNLALQGFARSFFRRNGRAPRVALSAVEHRASIETARALARANLIQLMMLPVDGEAQIDLDALRQTADRGVELVCIMGANNEVGTLYPLCEIGAIVASAGATFLCDAAQAAGKIPFSATDSTMSFVALSAHKMYGPKGVGALVVRRGATVDPIIFGGGHERGLRPGTVNVPGVVGLGEACRLRSLEMLEDEASIARLRDRLERDLVRRIDGLVVNGSQTTRLAGNLHVSVPDVPNGAIISRLHDTLAIATGAACSSGVEAPSHVLQAMGLPTPIQEGALRLGLGKFTTPRDVEAAADLLEYAVSSARKALRT